MKHSNFFKRLTVAAVLFLFCITSQGQGNLLVTPKRIVFDGAQRSQELNLANTGDDSATYQISFMQIRMKNDGGFMPITEPDSAQRFADKYLRYYPRTVTLGPREAQSVKIQLINQDKLEPGEYRSHIYLRSVAKPTPLGEKSAPTKADSSLSVSLTPVFGISLAVLIRKGENLTKATLTNLAHHGVDSFHSVKFTINRDGNMSLYGDINIDYISEGGKETRVAMVKGIAVYTPNAFRNMNIALKNIGEIDMSKGKLRVTYQEQSGKGVKFIQDEIQLSKSSLTSSR
jgi:hypothetical protein